jgi:hypothetical protein
MSFETAKKGSFSVKVYAGDAKALLAFNFDDKKSTKNLAGFTVQVEPDGQPGYYLHNELQFKTPGDHAQDASEPPNSSINAPIHKFRWVHVPGSVHQGTQPFLGKYTYTVTPRYFDKQGSMQPLDKDLSAAVAIGVVPFAKHGLQLGFTRGFTQSQAFVHHFGLKALIQPKAKDLLFDTSQTSGTNAAGEHFTYQDEYAWLGFTAREKIFSVLNEVLADPALSLAVFAYDLNEPDLMSILLKLAAQGRIRVILDNAPLHHNAKSSTPEDQFEELFTKAAKKDASILRGKFGRYAHDKVFIVSGAAGATQVLTGSTNFSITGLYVNSNHVIVFNDPKVAAEYARVFDESWKDGAKQKPFQQSAEGGQTFSFSSKQTPPIDITFSPHDQTFASSILNGVADRIAQEGKKGKSVGSVLFAVMQIDQGTSPVYTALQTLHAKQNIFSYGISDTTKGISLYAPGKKTGVLVTGKPASTQLPPPFDQVRGVGLGHQVHHKFVVCGFNGENPVVYCGSSNLALGGEQANGDNLLAIHDGDVATVFAIEALALVDHFSFLDRYSDAPKAPKKPTPLVSKQQAAVSAGWFLSTSDKWVAPYFDSKDLHCMDRQLFG